MSLEAPDHAAACFSLLIRWRLISSRSFSMRVLGVQSRVPILSLVLLVVLTAFFAPSVQASADAVSKLALRGIAFGECFTSSNHFAFESAFIHADFGSSIAVQDINNDGFEDLLVGARTTLGRGRTVGAAFYFQGSRQGVLPSPTMIESPAAEVMMFGASIACGDFNNDGQVDTAIAAPRSGISRGGSVFVWNGKSLLSNAPPSSVIRMRTPTASRVQLTASDLNGDSYCDLIIALPTFSDSLSNQGGVFAHFGSSNGLQAVSRWSVTGDATNAMLGETVAVIPDLNGDGVSEVVVSLTTRLGNGKLGIFFGGRDTPSSTPAQVLPGPAERSRFGTAVATEFDLNGDGFADLAVGAPADQARQSARHGEVHIYAGKRGGFHPDPIWKVQGNQRGEAFGRAIAVADMNGDGRSDFVISAPYATDKALREGAIYFFLNGTNGLPTAAQCRLLGGVNGRFGWIVNRANDLNGDGLSDVVVASPFMRTSPLRDGRLDVIYGRKGMGEWATCLDTNPSPVSIQTTEIDLRPSIGAEKLASEVPTSFRRFGTPAFGLMVFTVLIGSAAATAIWRRRSRRLMEQAAAHERARIARDLHDDLGAEVSLLQHQPGRAREVMLSLERAIWAIDPRRDTLANLVSFLGDYAEQFFDGTTTRCKVDLPAVVPEAPVRPEARKHLFLCYKEVLNNVHKHSQARNVFVGVALVNDLLAIEVNDDGVGIASPSDRGDGLQNMTLRIEKLGGTLRLDSQVGCGTRLNLTVPYLKMIS